MSLEHNYNNIRKYKGINKVEDKGAGRCGDGCNI